jgi:hypothetical protein
MNTTLAAITAATVEQQAAAPTPPARPARNALKEIRAQADHAAALGFSLPDTLFAWGHDLAPSGEHRAKLKQREVNDKPRATQALTDFREHYLLEKRRDVHVLASALLIDPKTGLLRRTNGDASKPGLLLTDNALAQLAQLLPWAPKNAAPYWGSIDPEWRSREFAATVQHQANVGYPLVLRLRRPDPDGNPDGVQWYATVSEKYTTVDPDAVVATVLSAIESDPRFAELRAEISYSGTRLRISLIDHTDLQPSQTKVGDVIRATATLKAADDKSGGLDTLVSLLRVLCVNLTTGVAKGMRMSLRHTGDRAELVGKLQANILAALRAGSEVVHGAWNDAAGTKVAAEDIIAIAKRLTAAEEGARKAQAVVAVPGTPAGALLSWILEAYALEPDQSQLGLVNAISRAPQVGSWTDVEDAGAILAAASGEVLRMSPARFRSLAAN